MAKISTAGLEELIEGLESIADIPDATILEMLAAEAAVYEEAQRKEAQERIEGNFSNQITRKKITHTKKLKTDADGRRCIYVYPQGIRTDGNRRRVADVAFVNEYGKKQKPGGQRNQERHFISIANAKAEDEAIAAAQKVYDDFIKSKNL